MEELLLERTLNSKSYLNEDGTRTMKYFGKPIHFDKNGTLEEIDTNFHLNTTSNPAYYLYNTVNNSFRIGLSENLAVNRPIKFSFRYDGLGDVYTTPKGMALYDSEKNEYTVFQTPQSNKSFILSNVATYENVYSGIDYEFHSLDDSLKEYIYITNKDEIPNPADYGYNPNTTYVVFIDYLETNLLELKYNDEQLEVYNEGVQKLTSPKEWAKDSTGNDLTIFNKFNEAINEYSFGLPYNEIQSASLPITIDPTWTTNKVEDSLNYDTCVIYGTTSATYQIYSNQLRNFYGKIYGSGEWGLYRSLLKLDIPNMSSNIVTNATLTFTGSVTKLQLRKIQSAWNLSTAYSTLYNLAGSAPLILDNINSASINITNTVKEWLSDPSTNHGLALTRYQEGLINDDYGFVNSLNDSTVTNRPHITITYTSAVTNFKGTPQTSNSIRWSWDNLIDAEKYVIYDNNNVKLTEIPSGTLNWTETGLSPNTTYTRKIRFVKAGVEDTTYVTAANNTYPTLVVPQSLVGTAVNFNTITWTWNDTVNSGITGFEVLDKFNNLKYSCADTVKTWTEKQLRYSTDYDRFIRTVRNGEKSALVKVTGRTQDRPSNVDEMTTTETIIASADTYLNSAIPSATHGNQTSVYIGRTTTALYRALFNFNTASISSHSIFKTMKLRLYENAYSGSPTAVDIYKVTQSWVENTVNWDTFPSSASNKLASLTFSPTTGRYYEVDIPVETLQSWITNRDNFGLMLRTSEATVGFVTLNSKENTFKPELVVSHEVPVAPLSSSNFRGSIKTGSSVLWEWNESISINAQGYRIYNADNDELVADVPFGISSYEETGLVMGNTYNRYIVAYNVYGESQITSLSYLFDQLPPSNIVGTPQSSSRILWSFDVVSGYNEYRIYSFNQGNGTTTEVSRIKFESGLWKTYLTPNFVTPIGNYATPKWLQSGIQPNTTKSIKVTSVGTTSESRLSDSVSATTNSLPNMTNLNGQKNNVNNLRWIIS